MKIVFFGTPDFGALILKKLIENNLAPVLVVTVPDKLEGRKQVPAPSAVKVEAQEQGIPVMQPESVSEIELDLKKLKPDLIILAAYGHLIPKNVLNIPTKGSLNVHPSLLPLFRGPSPVQTAILKGVERTGVTIMIMDEKIDHGPILVQEELSTPLSSLNHIEAKKQLAELGGNLLVKAILQYISGDINPKEQNHSMATYTEHLTRSHGKIDWTKTAKEIERQVRALNPWPGTFTTLNKKRMKILEGRARKILSEYSSLSPGTTVPFENGFAVITTDDVLLVQQLQMEGKNPVAAKDFLLGHKDFLGSILK